MKHRSLSLFAIFLFLMSCATSDKLEQRYQSIESQLKRNNPAAAYKNFRSSRNDYSSKDHVLFYLDKGILHFYNGEYERAIKAFNKAERRIEGNYTRSITAGVASFISNDYALVYQGDEYEDIYINIFKALSFINLGNKDAAFVEIRKMYEKFKLFSTRFQDEIEELNKKDEKKSLKAGDYNYTDSALGRYLSYLLYRSEGEVDDARIDFEKIRPLQKRYSQLYDVITEFEDNQMSLPQDSAVVNIMSFVDQGAFKYAWELTAVSFGDRLLVSGKNPDYTTNFWVGESDLNFRLAIPKIKQRRSRIDRVDVFLNGENIQRLEEIENFSKAALNNFKLEEDAIVFKSVMRSIAKSAATSYVNEKVGNYIFDDDEEEDDDEDDKKDEDNDTGGKILAGIFAIGFNIFMITSEQADLRTWRLLPKKALVGEILVPHGEHDLSIVYYDEFGRVIKRDERRLTLTKNKTLNMVTSYAF